MASMKEPVRKARCFTGQDIFMHAVITDTNEWKTLQTQSYGYEADNFKFVVDHSITAPQNKTSAILL